MESNARERYIRMPARKIRRVIDAVRGKSVSEAVNILKFMPYFAAKVVEKNIRCAAANATERWGSDISELVVSEAYADDGPTYKRAKPRAQGRMYKIQKRTSHLTVVVKVSEELKKKLEEKKKQAKKATTKAKTATKKAPAKPAKQVIVEEKPAEVIQEAKQELEQGITPQTVEMQPEIESPAEAEAEVKEIKPEVIQHESHTVETQEESKQEE
ncbi:MAG: 50S ribosomal protein L22 [Candidatus Melainabacteria bacterium GWF2_37_15]|nr:MAG: 50S ribosomal protein L22 [Candidatus Melainabacteria bacterium GWF2_37_15]